MRSMPPYPAGGTGNPGSAVRRMRTNLLHGYGAPREHTFEAQSRCFDTTPARITDGQGQHEGLEKEERRRDGEPAQQNERLHDRIMIDIDAIGEVAKFIDLRRAQPESTRHQEVG